MDAWIRRLEAWHRKHRPDILEELAPPARDSDLETLRARVGVALPEAYLALLRWHDGTKEGHYSGLQFNRQLMSIERTLEMMNVMDELVEAGEFDAPYWWRARWVPFLDNGGGDHICIDLEGCFGGEPGQIVEFWHDQEDRTVAYSSLAAWLECFVLGLEAGLFAEDEGDLHVTDDAALAAIVAERCPDHPKRFDAAGDVIDDDD